MMVLTCISIACGWLLQLELEPRRLGAESVKPRYLISDLVISDLVSLDMGVRRYVGFTPMLERTISEFRAGRRGCAASLLCRHINVIKNTDFCRL